MGDVKMDGSKNCFLICGIMMLFIGLAVSIVVVITFLSPNIMGLEDIEVKGNTDFRPIVIESKEETIVSGLDGKQQSVSTTVPKSKINEINDTETVAIHLETSTTLMGGNLTIFNKSIARLIVELPPEEMRSPSRKLYAGDTLLIAFNPKEGWKKVKVLLDGTMLGESTGDRVFLVEDLTGGEHEINVERNGISIKTVISVWQTRYGLSRDVRTLLTEEERRMVIHEGGASLRFYDIPNCANCIVMRPKVAGLAEKFRHCISYELVSLWKPSVREDLKRDFPDQSKVVTPVIVIEGPDGRFNYMGIVPPEKLEENIRTVAPACR